MNKYRIGYDAKRAFFNERGLGNYSRDLIRLLARHVPENAYFLFSKNNPKYTFANTQLVEPHGFWALFPALWRSGGCVSEIARQHLDIFHGLSGELPFGIHRLAIKKVVTVHDLITVRYPHLFSFTYRKMFIRKMRYACDVADTVVAISEQTRDDIVHFFGISPKKITVIYQGCHAQFRVPVSALDVAAVRDKYRLPEHYLLSVGAFEERKNQLRIIDALSLSSCKIPLVLLGNGSASNVERLMAHAARRGVQVILLRGVIFSDFPSIYAGARMLLFPSLFEGFGIPLLEAMCVGVPIVTSCGSCFAETAGEAALYVNPLEAQDIANAIEKILSDDTLANDLVMKGRAQARKFTDENIVKNLIQMYDNLICKK